MSVPKIVEIMYAIYQGLFKIQLCKEYVGRIVNNGSDFKFCPNFAFACSPSLFPRAIRRTEVQTYVCKDSHVTTKIFEINGLLNFLRYGAPPMRPQRVGAPLLRRIQQTEWV